MTVHVLLCRSETWVAKDINIKQMEGANEKFLRNIKGRITLQEMKEKLKCNTRDTHLLSWFKTEQVTSVTFLASSLSRPFLIIKSPVSLLIYIYICSKTLMISSKTIRNANSIDGSFKVSHNEESIAKIL